MCLVTPKKIEISKDTRLLALSRRQNKNFMPKYLQLNSLLKYHPIHMAEQPIAANVFLCHKKSAALQRNQPYRNHEKFFNPSA